MADMDLREREINRLLLLKIPFFASVITVLEKKLEEKQQETEAALHLVFRCDDRNERLYREGLTKAIDVFLGRNPTDDKLRVCKETLHTLYMRKWIQKTTYTPVKMSLTAYLSHKDDAGYKDFLEFEANITLPSGRGFFTIYHWLSIRNLGSDPIMSIKNYMPWELSKEQVTSDLISHLMEAKTKVMCEYAEAKETADKVLLRLQQPN